MRASGSPDSVAVISLEPWDEVWRRNQYLVQELLRQQLLSQVVFVNPPRLGSMRSGATQLAPGLTVIDPPLLLPKRAGGLRALARTLVTGPLRHLDVLWVNDPRLGRHCLRRNQPALYDVTDDWRALDMLPRIRRRLIAAEDALAVRARTVVCSEELRQRWLQRYQVEAAVVHNGIDAEAWRRAVPTTLAGPGPHIGYVGTLHEQRLDLELLRSLAGDSAIGTVHLVGPIALSESVRRSLEAIPAVTIHGPVHPASVPSWTTSFDVLICPHVVDSFTLSLDAIKSYEYLASGVPVVATASSGFQHLTHPRLSVRPRERFVQAVREAAKQQRQQVEELPGSWEQRAQEFYGELSRA